MWKGYGDEGGWAFKGTREEWEGVISLLWKELADCVGLCL